jgi:hypothetical protein
MLGNGTISESYQILATPLEVTEIACPETRVSQTDLASSGDANFSCVEGKFLNNMACLLPDFWGSRFLIDLGC